MSSQLEQLRQHTIVVADTGDFEQLRKYQPQDSTTNPSLIYAASKMPRYSALLDNAIAYALKRTANENSRCPQRKLQLAMDKVAVNFGCEILKIIPGRVSTEIDARLSFDTEGTIQRAREIIQMYQAEGVDTEKRVLIKIASTWEGLMAAKQLERENIHCNLTLLFSLCQAAVAGEFGITLISPFAGRITDFYKAKDKVDKFPPAQDPGVLSVQNIYNYLKKFGFKTVVMGASFRTSEQTTELAGCDLLTISPALLEDLSKNTQPLTRKLDPVSAKQKCPYKEPLHLQQKDFLFALCQDEMASFKLFEGIRKFTDDLILLEKEIQKRLQARL